MPADSDSLPLLPHCDARSNFINDARNFVAGNTWILNPRQDTLFDEHVTVADATGHDLNAHLPSIGLRNSAIDDFELRSGLGNLCSLHECYFWFRCDSQRGHTASSDFVLQSPLSTVLSFSLRDGLCWYVVMTCSLITMQP